MEDVTTMYEEDDHAIVEQTHLRTWTCQLLGLVCSADKLPV